MTSIIDFTTRRPVEDAIIEAQAEYAVMEKDFATSREMLAEAIFRMEVTFYPFTIGDVLHPALDESSRCPMCEGRFARKGSCFAVRMPGSLGGAWKAMHFQCFQGAKDWLR